MKITIETEKKQILITGEQDLYLATRILEVLGELELLEGYEIGAPEVIVQPETYTYPVGALTVT